MQLGLLTDMQFSCPTGLTGSYARGKTFDIMSKCTQLTLYRTLVLKGALPRVAHLEMLSLEFSSSSFVIRVNLLHF